MWRKYLENGFDVLGSWEVVSDFRAIAALNPSVWTILIHYIQVVCVSVVLNQWMSLNKFMTKWSQLLSSSWLVKWKFPSAGRRREGPFSSLCAMGTDPRPDQIPLAKENLLPWDQAFFVITCTSLFSSISKTLVRSNIVGLKSFAFLMTDEQTMWCGRQ